MKPKEMVHWLRSALRIAQREHPKTAVVLATGLFVWLMLVIAIWLGTGSIPRLRPWLETANGATWSDQWETIWKRSPFWFAVVLGTRTALNFAGPLILLASAAWFFLFELERVMQLSRIEQLRMLSAELVPSLFAVIRQRHPSANLDTQDQIAMKEVADRVAERWLAGVEKLEKSAASARG